MNCTVINRTNRILLLSQNGREAKLFPAESLTFAWEETADITVLPEEKERLSIQKRNIKEPRAGKTWEMETPKYCRGIPNFWFRVQGQGDCTVKINLRTERFRGLRLMTCEFDLFYPEAVGCQIEGTDYFLEEKECRNFCKGYRSLWIGDLINGLIFAAVAAWFCTLSVEHASLLYLLPGLFFFLLAFGSMNNLLRWVLVGKQLKKNGSLDLEPLTKAPKKLFRRKIK